MPVCLLLIAREFMQFAQEVNQDWGSNWHFYLSPYRKAKLPIKQLGEEWMEEYNHRRPSGIA